MVESFKGTQNCKESSTAEREILEDIEKTLILHGYETSELIHQYHIERLNEQNAQIDSTFGVLTVRCCFKGNTIQVRFWNHSRYFDFDYLSPFYRLKS